MFDLKKKKEEVLNNIKTKSKTGIHKSARRTRNRQPNTKNEQGYLYTHGVIGH